MSSACEILTGALIGALVTWPIAALLVAFFERRAAKRDRR